MEKAPYGPITGPLKWAADTKKDASGKPQKIETGFKKKIQDAPEGELFILYSTILDDTDPKNVLMADVIMYAYDLDEKTREELKWLQAGYEPIYLMEQAHLLTGFGQVNLYSYDHGYIQLLEGDFAFATPRGLLRQIWFLGNTVNEVKYELAWYKQANEDGFFMQRYTGQTLVIEQ